MTSAVVCLHLFVCVTCVHVNVTEVAKMYHQCVLVVHWTLMQGYRHRTPATPSNIKVLARADLARMIVSTCCATTLRTSSSSLLNSSKHAHAPAVATAVNNRRCSQQHTQQQCCVRVMPGSWQAVQCSGLHWYCVVRTATGPSATPLQARPLKRRDIAR